MQTSPHIYVETDIPAGLTIADWTRSQRTGRRPRLWHKLIGLA
jgi:hypothetical protein